MAGWRLRLTPHGVNRPPDFQKGKTMGITKTQLEQLRKNLFHLHLTSEQLSSRGRFLANQSSGRKLTPKQAEKLLEKCSDIKGLLSSWRTFSADCLETLSHCDGAFDEWSDKVAGEISEAEHLLSMPFPKEWETAAGKLLARAKTMAFVYFARKPASLDRFIKLAELLKQHERWLVARLRKWTAEPKKLEEPPPSFIPGCDVDREEWTVTYNGKSAEFGRAAKLWKYFLAIYDSGAGGIFEHDLLTAVWGSLDATGAYKYAERVNELIVPISLKIKTNGRKVFTLKAI